jgi:Predicted P-loop ATPase and inactivated derivatives
MNPGCKFDSVLTLIGAQGIAKSMFVDILGGKWYNDSIQTFTGKEAQEQLRGSWLVEIPEVDRLQHEVRQRDRQAVHHPARRHLPGILRPPHRQPSSALHFHRHHQQPRVPGRRYRKPALVGGALPCDVQGSRC